MAAEETRSPAGSPTRSGASNERPTPRDRSRRRASALIAVIAAIVVIGLVAVLVVAAYDNYAVLERGVTLEQVADEPDEFEGPRVAVSGELAEFVVRGRDFPLGEGFGETVLIVPTSGTRVLPWERTTWFR